MIAPGYQNVYFTLFLGLGALYTVKWLEEHSQTTVIRGLFIAGGILLPSAYWFLEHGSSFMPLQLAVSLGLVIFFTVMFLVWWKKRGLEEAWKNLFLYYGSTVLYAVGRFAENGLCGNGCADDGCHLHFQKK